MTPLSDGIPERCFPWVNVALNLDGSIAHSSLYPCALDGSCHAPLPAAIERIVASPQAPAEVRS
jgi:hypothetical protein